MASIPPTEYQLSCAEVHRQQLLRWGEAAKRAGVLQPFCESLERIMEHLVTEPLAWGEPLFLYQYLHLDVRHGSTDFVHVCYAVDKQRRIVYIKSFKLMPGHSLDDVE